MSTYLLFLMNTKICSHDNLFWLKFLHFTLSALECDRFKERISVQLRFICCKPSSECTRIKICLIFKINSSYAYSHISILQNVICEKWVCHKLRTCLYVSLMPPYSKFTFICTFNDDIFLRDQLFYSRWWYRRS